MVTKKKLEDYRSLRAELADLEDELNEMCRTDKGFGNDVIMNYTKGYPKPETVVGFDWPKFHRRNNLYTKIQTECEEIEQFVFNVDDSFARRVLKLYYIDGLSQRQVAKKVHTVQSVISRKIEDFWEKHTKNQKDCYNK